MHVRHHLPALRPAVHEDTIAAISEPLPLAERAGGKETPSNRHDVVWGHRLDRRDVMLRDDQDVDRRLWIDVCEPEHRVVLVLDVGGTLARDDTTEEAVGDRGPEARHGRLYNSGSPNLREETREVMGTCPKCKLTIHRNGNHKKLGSTWFHKQCPARPVRDKREAATARKA